VMYDNSLFYASMAEQKSEILQKNKLTPNSFILSTIHRDTNTDDAVRLNAIFKALYAIANKSGLAIVLPLHPRTAKMLEKQLEASLYHAITSSALIKLIEPASFFDMIVLEKNASMVITDSGGVQKESFFFKKPCVILRKETEWKEIVEQGAAMVVDADAVAIENAFDFYTTIGEITFSPIFGDGKAAEFICSEMIKYAR